MRQFGGSAVPRFGNSAVRQFGNSDLAVFGLAGRDLGLGEVLEEGSVGGVELDEAAVGTDDGSRLGHAARGVLGSGAGDEEDARVVPVAARRLAAGAVLLNQGVEQLGLHDLTAAQAGGADADALGRALDFGADGTEIDVPAALRHVVGVADVVAELRPLAADVTNLSHNRNPSIAECKPRF